VDLGERTAIDGFAAEVAAFAAELDRALESCACLVKRALVGGDHRELVQRHGLAGRVVELAVEVDGLGEAGAGFALRAEREVDARELVAAFGFPGSVGEVVEDAQSVLVLGARPLVRVLVEVDVAELAAEPFAELGIIVPAVAVLELHRLVVCAESVPGLASAGKALDGLQPVAEVPDARAASAGDGGDDGVLVVRRILVLVDDNHRVNRCLAGVVLRTVRDGVT
jgi:hypothetical protein